MKKGNNCESIKAMKKKHESMSRINCIKCSVCPKKVKGKLKTR